MENSTSLGRQHYRKIGLIPLMEHALRFNLVAATINFVLLVFKSNIQKDTYTDADFCNAYEPTFMYLDH